MKCFWPGRWGLIKRINLLMLYFTRINLFFLQVVVLLWTLPVISFAQQDVDFYISNKGNDNNSGTSVLLPKKTLAGIAPLLGNVYAAKGRVKIALKSGDIFEQTLLPPCPVQLNTFTDNLGQNEFAILNGSREFATGWVLQPGTFFTFKQDISYTGFTGYGINGIGSYSFMYVLEIDKTLEKTAPFTARKLLKFLPGITAVENTAGSFYIPVNTVENPAPVYIHSSDGSSPNVNSKYRYEVTVRDWAVNSTYQPDNNFENLWIRGFGAGNGMIPSGANSYYNKMIFGPGAAIHHLVVRSGTINHSLFLPGPKNTNEFAVVFYDQEGLRRHCAIKNSMFFDIPEPVYTHTSYGTNYGAVEIDNVLAFADSADANGFMYTFNNDSVIINNLYTDQYKTGYNYGNATYAAIDNSYFKEVSFGIAYSPKFPVVASVKNVFIKTKGTDFTTGIFMQSNTNLTLTNSIIHVVNSGASGGAFVFGGGGDTSKTVATGNIFICDIEPTKSLTAASINTGKGIATSKDRWNNNVYILLRGNKILWLTTNAATNGGSPAIQSFEEWKRQSGQDQNSLFFDLRNDPRGLKAIFADPENGNYDLANTTEGKQVAALGAGMTSPITCFLQRPTYEQAAALVRRNKVLSVNTCRNPCLQNKIRIDYTFDTTVINKRQVKLKWNISEQQNIDHYELQRSLENFRFVTIYKTAVTADSLYSFVDNLQSGIEYHYRVLIKPKGAGECFSDTRAVKLTDNNPFILYPNPSSGKMMISMNGYFGALKITVSNSTGQIVLVKEVYSWYLPIDLDISNQPKGIYFLKTEKVSGTAVQKFILQ